MASTGSYTDNPGYLTLRSIHSRHRPVLDFMETSGAEHEHGTHHSELQEHSFPNRTESFSRKRIPSGSGKRISVISGFTGNRKKMLAPLKDEDLNKAINDRYWGITLPAKMDCLISDGLMDHIGDHGSSNGHLSTPPSPVSFEYHSEESCLKCFNYLENNETGFNFSKFMIFWRISLIEEIIRPYLSLKASVMQEICQSL